MFTSLAKVNMLLLRLMWEIKQAERALEQIVEARPTEVEEKYTLGLKLASSKHLLIETPRMLGGETMEKGSSLKTST